LKRDGFPPTGWVWRRVPAKAIVAKVDQAKLCGELYTPYLLRGCRPEQRSAACRECPHVAIERATGDVHLAGGAGAEPFGNAAGAGVLRQNGGDRV
jgi:hypothetical protein